MIHHNKISCCLHAGRFLIVKGNRNIYIHEMTEIKLDQDALKTVADRVYERLKIAILSGEISAGDRVSERDMAEQMGISTSPIKRALNRLHMEGLVNIKPRKGTYVTPFSPSNIDDIAEIRAALEGVAARLAARNATDEEIARLRGQIILMEKLTEERSLTALVEANTEFHHMVRKLSRNTYISRLIETVHSFDIGIRRRALSDQEESKRGFKEHSGIFHAIAQRNGELAEKRIREHVLRTSSFVVEEIVEGSGKKNGST